MTTRRAFKFISLACGSGGTVLGMMRAGGQPRFVCDPRSLEVQNVRANFPGLIAEEVDARWFYNRKARGVADILAKAGIAIGELDILEGSVTHSGRDNAAKALPSLYELFGLAKSLQPKIVIGIGPAYLCSDKNLPFLENPLRHLRYVKPAQKELERAYYANFRVLNSVDFGAAISRDYSIVLAVRADVAQEKNLAADRAILGLFPSLLDFKPLVFSHAIEAIQNNPGEEDFWTKQLLAVPALAKAQRFLPKNPEKTVSLSSYGDHQVKRLGFKKSEGLDVHRVSLNSPLPDSRFINLKSRSNSGLIHPTKSRLLTPSEIAGALGFPADFKFSGTEIEKIESLEESIPPALVTAVAQSVFAGITKRVILKATRKNSEAQKVQLAETLLSASSPIRTYYCGVDKGDQYAATLEKGSPSEDDYDYLFDADEIGEDFVVYGPVDPSTGERRVIGGIKRQVYNEEDKKRLVAAINKIKSKSGYRGACSPEKIWQKTLDDFDAKGRKYRLSEDGRQYYLWIEAKGDKKGHWDRPRTNPIPSATEGWSPDKNTRKPQLSKTFSTNPELKADFDYLNQRAASAYYKIAPLEFRRQEKFLKARMNPKYFLGKTVFTSLAINKYGDEMPAMNYHIDNGDNNSGLTSISVFNKGQYKGGYFVLPQFRCAFKIGDCDVFVGNSRKIHGVTRIDGKGQRFSVVSYANTSLAVKEYADKAYPAKSPRPNFRATSYEIAIPSFKRAETLKKKTLALLTRHKIDPKRVTIFVANEAELKTYKKALKDTPYKNLIVGELGIMEIRNFMWKHYAEGTPVLFIDDDIKEMKMLVPGDNVEATDKKNVELIPVEDLERDLIIPGFNMMREHSAYIWGINAANNDFYMKNQVSVGLYYIIASFYGAIIRHDDKLLCGTDDKEDYERSVQHFIKDGRVVRLSFATADTAYYKEPGGMNATRNIQTVSKGAEYMLRKYPKYCIDKGLRPTGINKGMREIQLKEDMDI
jgi:site-specific DNA-cytosine methylase